MPAGLNGTVGRSTRFELRTARTVVRVLARSDITEFTRYRNLPEISRYQDWSLPFTRDVAHDLVDEMEALRRPTPDRWIQLAIDPGTGLIGDIAVWLDSDAALAMIGYTVAPEHQGSGFATEAASAVIDHLFNTTGVHRIAATIDPRNVASARVLERCGFARVGVVPSAAFVRGEWTDDARYTMLAADREAWKHRTTDPIGSVDLIEVTSDNVRAVCNLSVAPSQRRFVSTVAESIADAAHPDAYGGGTLEPWYRAISADGDLAGFIMTAERTEHHDVTYLWRFMVDHRFQGRGVGRAALGALARRLIERGETKLELSFSDGPGSPEPFYASLGFERTGDIEDGEIVARTDLATLLVECDRST